MADIQSLAGIGEAREALFNDTRDGKIPENRANICERMLRGQQELKGDLPIKAVKLFTQFRGMPKAGDFGHPHVETLLSALTRFLGSDRPAITG